MRAWLSQLNLGPAAAWARRPVWLGGQAGGDEDRSFNVPVRDWVAVGKPSPVSLSRFDQALVWVVLSLVVLGTVMVFSATVALPDNPKFARYASSHFLTRHILSIALALMVGWVTLKIPVDFWEKYSVHISVFAVVLLALVLVPFIGKGVNGARRWIPLGVMNFQPSELAKLAMALYAAGYMLRKMDVKQSFMRAVAPMIATLVVVGALLLAEPDMGAFLVITAIAFGIVFLGGVNLRVSLMVLVSLVLVFSATIIASPWRRERIFAYLDPWSEQYTLGKAYQLSHSLIAFGRGEWWGQGLGNSVEKLHYLPEAHTDFMLAVVGEELGFLGVLFVILAFFWLVRRIFMIGRNAILIDKVFAGLLAQGIGVWMGGQAFINMGVNLGVLPTKGLTLPLMSFGGSAMLINFVALAIVLRIDIENRRVIPGDAR